MVKKSEMVRGTRFGDLFDRLSSKPFAIEVPRLTQLEKSDFINDYGSHSRPFILSLQSTVSEDPLVLIRRDFGTLRIKVRLGDYADPHNYAPERRQLEEMSVTDYMNHLASIDTRRGQIPPPYAGNFRMPEEVLRTWGAGAPVYYALSRFEPPTVWIGASNSLTPLHRDSTDNFALQLVGSKRWTIFPPQDAAYLYMSFVSASPGGDFATSAVDLRNPDLERFPAFASAHPITFELHAGEMLYLPMGWSHFVENLELSLMVNYWLSVKPSGIAALDDHSFNK